MTDGQVQDKEIAQLQEELSKQASQIESLKHTLSEETTSTVEIKTNSPKPAKEGAEVQENITGTKGRSSATVYNLHQRDNQWKLERKRLVHECVAEFLGTCVFVMFGTGSVMAFIFAEVLEGFWQMAAVWGLGLTVGICIAASISGAHLNPAISLAFALLRRSRKFGWAKLVPYVISQVLGAMLGSWINYMMYASVIVQYEQKYSVIRDSVGTHGTSGMNSARAFGEYWTFESPVTTAQAFLAEAFGTCVLAGVIFALTHPGNDTMKHNVYIPPLIGLTLAGLFVVIGPLTQMGLNPARDFGPRIVAYAAGWTGVAFKGCWLYIVAPIVGAPIGGLICDYIMYVGEDKGDTAATSHD